MKVRKLDSNGDIVTHGETWATDAEAVAQTAKTRLNLFLGEYFRDITDGMPWFEKEDGSQGIFGKGYSLAQVESLIRRRILETPEVLKILRFTTDFDNNERRLNVECTILTTYGEATFNYGNAY